MRHTLLGILLAASTAGTVVAQDDAPTPAPPPTEHPVLRHIAAQVQPSQLHATIARLVGFGTRHTMSSTTSRTRGIGAARHWVKSRFEAISADCGGCLTIVTPHHTVTGERLPTPTRIENVVAIQRGTTDPNRVIIITAHLDSRVTDVMNKTADAPGADDDGSGTAAVIEAARVLSKYRFPATVVYASLSGEEQGLYGGKLMASYARAQHWQVESDFNNDIIGNTHGIDGVVDNTHVRVFSEGTKSTETAKQAAYRRYFGGEVDSPSRNVARFMADLAQRYLTNFHVMMIYRTDRYGRGGDQVPFLAAGYPAVRVTEAHENYTRQHQDLRTEHGIHYGDVIDGVDFDYLAQVTRLNLISMAAMAWAPAPPTDVSIKGAVEPDTHIHWTASPGAAGYRVWWRQTTAPQWQHHRWVGNATQATLKDIVIDNSFFGVSAVSANGFASPVEFPGNAGSFITAMPEAARPAGKHAH
ncbi:M28 family peptidase [Oleiagrimonas sp. C23AA]|nr:M28 family peptidase [Oleiagrimonas sp. C23AA]NII11276.1 M28 family peptidase [Oleiagrimonas sp. C23AA]